MEEVKIKLSKIEWDPERDVKFFIWESDQYIKIRVSSDCLAKRFKVFRALMQDVVFDKKIDEKVMNKEECDVAESIILICHNQEEEFITFKDWQTFKIFCYYCDKWDIQGMSITTTLDQQLFMINVQDPDYNISQYFWRKTLTDFNEYILSIELKRDETILIVRTNKDNIKLKISEGQGYEVFGVFLSLNGESFLNLGDESPYGYSFKPETIFIKNKRYTGDKEDFNPIFPDQKIIPTNGGRELYTTSFSMDTDFGVLSLVAYNCFGGYYSHEVTISSADINMSTEL